MSSWKERGKLSQQIEEYLTKNQFKKALKVSQKLLKMDPNNCDTLYNMGMIYAYMKDLKEAERCNQKILDIKPNDVDALINMAQLHEIRHNSHQAMEYYQKALDSDMSRIFRVEKLWELALLKYKDDVVALKKIVEQCIYSGDLERLMNLEARTKVLGPENFKIAAGLASIAQKFQMILHSPLALADFPEKFFLTNEVWDEFMKQLRLDLGVPFFNPTIPFKYEDVNQDALERLNQLKQELILENMIKGIRVLDKDGKYETTEQMMANRDRYNVERVN